MKQISVLIKPASGLCNLKCTYCFYADVTSLREVKSYGIMKNETMQRMIDQLFADLVDGDQLTLAFQGGEPTLIGLRFYQKLTDYVEEWTKRVRVEVNYALQTNGTLIDEKWAQFLKHHQFLVGLSIDGSERHHNLYRLDGKGRGTFERIKETKDLLDNYEVDYNVLCVLTEPMSHAPDEVFNFIKKENIEYIQFIPCLDSLSKGESNKYALTPRQFA